MLELLGVAVCTILLVVSVVGVAAGTIKAGSGASRSSSATWRAHDAMFDDSQDIERFQRDSREGMLDQAAGLAEAAINAPTLATPGISPNPVVLGLGEGMSLGQLGAQALGDGSGPDGGSGSGTGSDSGDANAGSAGSGSGTGDGSAGSDGSGSESGDAASDSSGSGSDDDGAPVANAPATHYVAWYADNIGGDPIWITTVEEYEAPALSYNYPGGGLDPTVELEKVALTGAFPTSADAERAVRGMMSNPRYMQGIYAGTPAADIGGNVHNLEYIGGLDWWQ